MTLATPDPTSVAVQQEINAQVWQKVSASSTYTLSFGRTNPRKVTALSAEGAQELYAQCAVRQLCPQLELLTANDKVVEGNWIVDAVFRATEPATGNTFTVNARGSEPYLGANQDPLSVVNRKAMGKALRNAHLKVVPLVIRKAYIEHLSRQTGESVHMSDEEIAQDPIHPSEPPPHGNDRVSQTLGKTKAITEVYLYAKSVGLDPRENNQEITEALGVPVPDYVEYYTVAEAKERLNEYLAQKEEA